MFFFHFSYIKFHLPLIAAGVFHDTFSTIRTTPLVLYPSLNTKQFDLYQELIVKEKFDKFTFVSINRYTADKAFIRCLDTNSI